MTAGNEKARKKKNEPEAHERSAEKNLRPKEDNLVRRFFQMFIDYNEILILLSEFQTFLVILSIVKLIAYLKMLCRNYWDQNYFSSCSRYSFAKLIDGSISNAFRKASRALARLPISIYTRPKLKKTSGERGRTKSSFSYALSACL